MASEHLYSDKNAGYFSGQRSDFIDRLSIDPSRAILEIGCGDAATGAYAKRTGKCGRYVGIELCAPAAESARRLIDEVHVANIESFDLPYPEKTFDVLIASEVLEHLIDPWTVLRKLRTKLKPGAQVFASSPNVAHKSILKMLIAGDWKLEDSGIMDRTHLRWFTPKTYAAMFVESGFDVLQIRPLTRPRIKARIFNRLTGNRLKHLFISQIVVEARVTDQ